MNRRVAYLFLGAAALALFSTASSAQAFEFLGRRLHGHGGWGASSCCGVVESDCGCAAEPDCGCAAEPDCGCAAPADCCEPSSCDPCARRHHGCFGLLHRLFHHHKRCCAAPTDCCAPASCDCSG